MNKQNLSGKIQESLYELKRLQYVNSNKNTNNIEVVQQIKCGHLP